ncbi:aldehyde dehydrogenase [Mahella australiensis]|uniref:Aldehyde Dehydrogenase n=1 Tax=Mahella australiensis (strain DSM 15567 / CIP 107919 / 50-1 BON) TaxID=697281 RepID=F4A1J2_MAHA5|nr:aldehyde dehydrogenase [Mahella australiensis]AEE96026.1 Aldehyde Dehydrogenase [Mahella australiensis 50-1 BON]
MQEDKIAGIVEAVLKKLAPELIAVEDSVQDKQEVYADVAWEANETMRQDGIFDDVESALDAAAKAQRQLVDMGMEKRKQIISSMRKICLENAERLAEMAWKETRLGRYQDKIVKNRNAALLTPGVEDLEQKLDVGDVGMILTQRGPFGLVISVEPTTNPTSSLINHSIAMVAAGNAVYFAPHPRALKVSLETISLLNKAITEVGGPANVVVTARTASVDNVNKAFAHKDVKLIVATGGAALVKAAMTSGKKCIAGGPGNPPVVVDETANIELAAKNIVLGASFDNNMLCISEKEVFAVQSICDELIAAMERNGNYIARGDVIDAITELVVTDGHINGKFVGQNPSVILRELGINISDEIRAIIMEVSADHPLVTLEQLMPILPIVRVRDFEEALQLSVAMEHGFRHTAAIYTKDYERAARFAQVIEATLTVINVPTYTGLGGDGIGKPTMTVAGPTGEGITSPRTYTRERNAVFGGSLSIK